MKPTLKFKSAATLRFILMGTSLLAGPCVYAATLHWDGADTTANADGGAAIWNLTNSNWDSAASGGSNQIWSNATPDSATFGGTADTVTMGSTVLAGGLTFNHSTGTYTIAGGSSSNVLSTGAVTIVTTAGGTTNLTAPLFQTGTLTLTNAGNLSVNTMMLGAGSSLSSSTSNLSIGSVTAPIAGQSFTLRGAGGGEVTGIMSLSTAGVTKNDAGTWTLSNAKNLYTGTTTVTAGTLKYGASNALGIGSNALSIANAASAVLDLNGYNATVGSITAGGSTGGTITNNSGSGTSILTVGTGNGGATFTGQIKDTGSGKVALTKVGTGTQIFNGSVSNAFTGGINVNGGVLTLDSANMVTPNDLVGSANTLGLGGGSFRITGKATATTNQTLGNVTLNAGGGQILATNNSATNIINLSLGSLNTSAAGGSLLVGSTVGNTTGLTITTTTDKDARGIYGGRTVFFDGTANTGYDWATTVSGASPYALSAYSGYATAWSTTASANVAGGTDTNNSLINNTGTATVTTTLTGPVVTNTLKIANAETNGTQTLAVAGQSLTLTGGGLLSTGSRAYTISGTAGATRLTAGNGSGSYDLTVHQYNSGGLTISAVIGDNGGNATSLTKAGGQALTLSGINTFTGRTYLNGGTLNINSSSTTSGTTMAAGTILSLGNASGLGSGDLTMNGGTFNNSTGAPLTLDNALNIGGDVAFNSSALNNITQQTGAVTLTGNNIITVSNNIVTLNGNVGGTGGFFKQGNGTLTLGGASNTYSGPTMINAGTLNINSAIASDQLMILTGTVNLGASNVLPSSASVTVDGNSSTVWNLGGFNQTIGTLGLGCGNGGAKVTVSGVGSTLTLTGGIVTSSHNSGAGGNITVSTLDLNSATQNFFLGGHGTGTDEISISSVVQNGGINIVGTGATTAVTLSNANTYSGATSINLATLRLGHFNALQSSPLDTMGTGTVTLAAGAGAYTLGGLSGSKNLASVITGTPTSLTTLTLNPVSGATHSYSGAIGDLSTGMGLTKSGLGTQVLSGTNGYTGATNVDGGTLAITGSGSINTTSGLTIGPGGHLKYNSSTALSIGITNNGGKISGTGAIGVNLGLNSTADVLAPGNSPGIQPFGASQSWSSFTYEWETNNFTGTTAGTHFDQISITGNLDLTGGAGSYILDVISLTAGNIAGNVPNFSETNRSWDILTTTGTITGFNDANWTIDTSTGLNVFTSSPASAGTWDLNATSNTITLNYIASVPEPSAALLGGMGLLLLLRRRRRVE